ncbi:MAG TPA: tetratricopeptide repeat protein, partial [Chthoniobacterales bacterium]|nr:tetratricopeptide repeat protein [Chthoniobacterales bacterium]
MKKLLPFLILTLVTLGVYAPALRNGFVWDDTALVLRDPFIRSWRLIPAGFEHFLFTDATASNFYRPVQRLTYTLDYALAGFHPAIYHFTSIICHALAAAALLLFARELLRAFDIEERRAHRVALLGSLAWAVHPLHTGAVAYVSGRADSLCALFGFAALYAGLLSRRATARNAFALTALAALLLLLSLLSKEAGVVFVAAWLVIAAIRKNRAMMLRAAAVVAVVSVSYTVLRACAMHTPPPEGQTAPLVVRLLLMLRAVAEYAGLIIAPVRLHMERDVETHPFGLSPESMNMAATRELQTLAGLLIAAAFLYWLVRQWSRDRVAFTFLVLAVIAYLPVSGVVPLNASVAEHWIYLPSALLFVGAAYVVIRFLSVRRSYAPAFVVLASVWLIFLAGRTFVRTFDWKDQRTFLERTIASGGDSARMLINLGALEMHEGRLDVARHHLERALQKEPNQPLAVINLAAVSVKQNDFASARALLQRATAMPLVAAQAHELLAVLESRETGNANLLRMRLASRTGPPNWQIEKRYIQLLDEFGRTDAAIEELKRCLETQWYRSDSWRLLSELLTKAS